MTKLQKILNEKGITQFELANAVNMTDVTISRYATGKRTPTIQAAIRIAEYLGVDALELFCDDLRKRL